MPGNTSDLNEIALSLDYLRCLEASEWDLGFNFLAANKYCLLRDHEHMVGGGS